MQHLCSSRGANNPEKPWLVILPIPRSHEPFPGGYGPYTIHPGAHGAINGFFFGNRALPDAGLTVLGGGRLSGEGYLPSTTILPKAVLAPGNSIKAEAPLRWSSSHGIRRAR